MSKCPQLQVKDHWPWCAKFSAHTSGTFCQICQTEGEEYIHDLFDQRDGRKPRTPCREKTKKPKGLRRALRAASEGIGRMAGGPKVTKEEVQKRAAICRNDCELLIQDKDGDWCGELLRLRFGEDAKKRKGCGCLLDVKRLYKNFDCPRKLWPAISQDKTESLTGKDGVL